jgi:hypothetical protein
MVGPAIIGAHAMIPCSSICLRVVYVISLVIRFAVGWRSYCRETYRFPVFVCLSRYKFFFTKWIVWMEKVSLSPKEVDQRWCGSVRKQDGTRSNLLPPSPPCSSGTQLATCCHVVEGLMSMWINFYDKYVCTRVETRYLSGNIDVPLLKWCLEA